MPTKAGIQLRDGRPLLAGRTSVAVRSSTLRPGRLASSWRRTQELCRAERTRPVDNLGLALHTPYVPIVLGSGICGAIAAREALGLRVGNRGRRG